MRGSVVIIVMLSSALGAQERRAERASPSPREHTAARAGIDQPAAHGTTSVTPRNVLGSVNGTTFGMDNSLFGRRPGRLFPGLWPQGHAPTSHSQRYATDGPIHVPDILALKPFRRAVAGAKADHEHASPAKE
jgi:hypothetical protein